MLSQKEIFYNLYNDKKIRHKKWGKNCFIHIKKGILVDEEGKIVRGLLPTENVEDWELYREPLVYSYEAESGEYGYLKEARLFLQKPECRFKKFKITIEEI